VLGLVLGLGLELVLEPGLVIGPIARKKTIHADELEVVAKSVAWNEERQKFLMECFDHLLVHPSA
jgi:hypothetical protein